MSSGLAQVTFLANLLITLYAKYGALHDAHAVFDKIDRRTVVTWTGIVTVYAKRGHGDDALKLYRRMHEEGEGPNKVTFISILGAFASQSALFEGKKIHACIAEGSFQSDVVVGTALVNMYGKCGAINDARVSFDKMLERNLITWNAMISMYAHHEQGKEALHLFQQMQTQGIQPDEVTFINVLSACASVGEVTAGRIIHSWIVDSGFQSGLTVANALVNMYGKCGVVEEARSVFDKMQPRDWVSWNAIITAYAQQGNGKDALELFKHMQDEGIKPDKVTFTSILGACASLAALVEGKLFHACLLDDGLDADVTIGNALVSMYGRCGALDDAYSVFYKVHPYSFVSWTAIIAAYAQQGHAREALELFREMQQEGVKPDEVTFISLLSACSHAGLLQEGQSCFASMEKDYGLLPKVEHCMCMIDLLGRAGLLDEAEELICRMPSQAKALLWSALLAACRIHGDTERGMRAAKHTFDLDPQDVAPYVLLSNIHAVKGRWVDAESITLLEEMLQISQQSAANWG